MSTEVPATLVKELREKTGAGVLECKKVLTETGGDLEKAVVLLREKGTPSITGRYILNVVPKPGLL